MRGKASGMALLVAAALAVWAAGEAHAADRAKAGKRRAATKKALPKVFVTAEEMRDNWILDGKAELKVLGKYELEVKTISKMALWCPKVYEGRVTVEFDCLMKDPKTACLIFIHGHGSDGRPVWKWKRSGIYDEYNAGRMEVYSIGFNRGPHVSRNPSGQLANVRRIGGPEFSIYTVEKYRQARKTKGRRGVMALRRHWHTKSLMGGALEPSRGLNKFIRYKATVDSPWLFFSVDGIRCAEFVDNRPNPLTKGSVGIRCMKAPRTLILRNMVIEGKAVESK